MLGPKWKYGWKINVAKTTFTGRSIAIILKAKKTKTNEVYVYSQFYIGFIIESKAFYFYATNKIKSNEGAINCIHANFLLVWYSTRNICSPNNLYVWSTKLCNCFGKIYNARLGRWRKWNISTFYNKIKSQRKVLCRDARKFSIKELIYKI